VPSVPLTEDALLTDAGLNQLEDLKGEVKGNLNRVIRHKTNLLEMAHQSYVRDMASAGLRPVTTPRIGPSNLP